MGGINDYETLAELMKEVKEWGLKVAIYSGHEHIEPIIEPYVDYYKVGPYKPKYGPLNQKTTNQRFYKKENNEWVDITYKFQKERV
jgi:anaerobic ribonucleoside-triphosphate reductase activating protein